MHQRENICKFIENLLKQPHPEYSQTPEYTVNPYGSRVNGSGFKGCDIDVYVGTENDQDLDPNALQICALELQWKYN